jgi:RND superfamily putative drug exporter
MLLVPATMELLGDRNWWLPGWLDRILPSIDVEGHSTHRSHGTNADGADADTPNDDALDDDPVPVA